jgi:RimJ/RimL family protein N-acetyltransferase
MDRKGEAMKFVFVDRENPIQIKKVEELAGRIWREHYSTILENRQIEYMLEHFQSFDAIQEQIACKNYQYYLLNQDNVDIGFTGIIEEPDKKSLFLSKIYIDVEYRGRGYASETFAFLEEICRNKNYHKIWLTVNRYNESSIRAYEKKGFRKVRTQVTDIGEGYVMDDYVMEKEILLT